MAIAKKVASTKLTKAEVKATSALTKPDPATMLAAQMKSVADTLASTPVDKLMPELEIVRAIIKGLEYAVDLGKKRLAEHVLKKGTEVEGTGATKEWNGIRARPSRSTLDPKKVEARVRSIPGLDITSVMVQVITYKVPEEGDVQYDKFMQTFDEEDREAMRHDWKPMLDMKNSTKGEHNG